MLGNIFILGDSYSTFDGHMPSGYASYYGKNGPYYLVERPELVRNDNDVCDEKQTWWYTLTEENGHLIENNSWSGSPVCNTGYEGADCSGGKSFISRIDKYIAEGYFDKNPVDTLFVFGGTNDSWANSPLGGEIFDGWTSDDLFCVLPAFSYLIHRLVTNLPNTKIYCIINTGLKKEIEDFYIRVCERNGIGAVKLCDIDKVSGHPTVKGMAQIKEQVLGYVNS